MSVKESHNTMKICFMESWPILLDIILFIHTGAKRKQINCLQNNNL